MSDYVLPIITELCPKPSSGSEWVELYNPLAETVSLAGWQLWDQLSQPSLLYTFADYSIAPYSFAVVEVGKKLNDSGDGVILLDSESNVIDMVHYQTAQPDLGYSRTDLLKQADFAWQLTSPNSFIITTISPTLSATQQPTPSNSMIAPLISPSPSLFAIPTWTPTPPKSPTPLRTATPTNTYVPTPSTNITFPMTPTPAIHHSNPSATLKPPTIPSLNSLTPVIDSSQTATISGKQQATVPPPKLDRLVFFPSSQNPMAAVNVIIGGLVIGFHAAITVWIDWQKHHATTYY